MPDAPMLVHDEPPIKPPPILEVGVLAWVRKNLFGSTIDTILTLIAAVLIVTVTYDILYRAITQSNWFVVTRNLRQFMAGTYAVDQLWRLHVMVLLITFAIGFTWYAYTHIRWRQLIVPLVLVIFTAVIPPVVYAVNPPAATYLTAGSTSIASGTVTETPLENVGFIAGAGETVRITVAHQATTEAEITTLAGFTDRATNALVNNALNRIRAIDQLAALDATLAGDLLTQTQREELTAARESLTIPDPVTETYAINSQPIAVELLDGATLEVLASAALDTTTSVPLEFTLPADGWYIIRKTVAGDALGVLRVEGAYPLIERNFTRTQADGSGSRFYQYVRLTDDFTTEAIRPQIDGRDVSALIITDHQYRGTRPFNDFMLLAGAPMLELLSRAFIPMAAMIALGFAASAGVVAVTRKRGAAQPANLLPKQAARTASTWLWIVVLIAASVLIYGIPNLDARRLGLILAAFVWVGWMYFAGIHLNREWGRPLFYLITVLGFIQFVIAENPNVRPALDTLFGGGGFSAAFAQLPITQIIGIVIWLYIGIRAANMGNSARGRWDASAGTRALIVTGVLWIAAIVLPLIILSNAAGSSASDMLPVVDTRTWGGLLLTSVLTVFAILASFPLGVLLALGRRSKLPVVKWACIVYIELVRGVPLITVLFMAQLLVPLANPQLANVDNVFRAMIGLMLFSAAYLAENVRGGLQSVPHGQEEAAKALGLNGLQVTLFITLPQALRAVIPALVGQCIALFKDTTLVALVGLTDLFGTARTTIAQPEYIGLQGEVYLFIGVVYYVFCYGMAYVSRRIEFSGSGAANKRSV